MTETMYKGCMHGVNIRLICEICENSREQINNLCLIEEIKLKLDKLEKEIELLKNKDNHKCEHGLEKHIECSNCNVRKLVEKTFIGWNNYFKENKINETFNFMTSVKHINDNKKVRRKKWPEFLYIIKKFDDNLISFCINNDDNTDHDAKFTVEDLISDDWEIFE